MHASVVKTVKFRDNNIFASAGNDSEIIVVDIRLEKSKCSTCKISGFCNYAINSLQWCTNNENIIMSSSFDTKILLFDIRSIDKPLLTLESIINNIRTLFTINKKSKYIYTIV